MKKFFSFLLAVLFAVYMNAGVLADTIDEKKNELNKVTNSIYDYKDELNRVRKEQKSVSSQISAIDEELDQKQIEYNSISNKLLKTQNEIQDTKEELALTEAKLAKAQESLAKTKEELEAAKMELEEQQAANSERLRAMYINNTSSSYLELLFKAESINDFFNKLFMIKRLMSYDQKVIEDMEKAKEEIERKKSDQEKQEKSILNYKKEIENKKNLLYDKEAELQTIKNKLSKQKEDIEKQKEERQSLYASLEEEKAKINRQLDELERQSKELEAKIQQLVEEQRRKQQEQKQQNPPNPSRGDVSNGKLSWPVPGYEYQITSPFGYRVHPITGAYKYHSGLDISGYLINGKPVVAANDGVVIMSQWYSGYGNTVIIDHGNGMTTLYGHNSQLTVSVGQYVKRGETIAKVGSTGLSTGPHSHFEVRINGVADDPMKYLK